MPDFNDTLGSLCLNALLVPVKAGGVKSDAIRAVKCPSQLTCPVLARFCTERHACLPLLRAGLTMPVHRADAVQKTKSRKKQATRFFARFKICQWAYGYLHWRRLRNDYEMAV
jgi:hypothetical protein